MRSPAYCNCEPPRPDELGNCRNCGKPIRPPDPTEQALEQQLSSTTHLLSDLGGLAAKWEELGIDPDDFLRCATCHRFIPDLVEGTEPPVEPDELCACDA